MDAATIDELVTTLADRAGLTGPIQREPVRAWALSAVERLRLPDGSSVIYKYAVPPFSREAATLRHVARHGVPIPQVLAAEQRPDVLGMLLEDLGEPAQEPTLAAAAAAAVATHRTPAPATVPNLDTAGLVALPGRALASLGQLAERGRWSDVDDIARRLKALDRLAGRRAAGAELPPFGLCHSEFHVTSLHVDAEGHWRLLDWARAFSGPGLLDLASWQNTNEAPDLDAFHQLLVAYLAAGGAPDAAAPRGGLDPARWAYGWHRIWAIEWYLHQARTWTDPATDALYQNVIRRHLDEALECLDATTATN